MEERINALAIESMELSSDLRSNPKFHGNINASVEQVVNEQDVLGLTTIGEVMNYRTNLISEVKKAIDAITPKYL